MTTLISPKKRRGLFFVVDVVKTDGILVLRQRLFNCCVPPVLCHAFGTADGWARTKVFLCCTVLQGLCVCLSVLIQYKRTYDDAETTALTKYRHIPDVKWNLRNDPCFSHCYIAQSNVKKTPKGLNDLIRVLVEILPPHLKSYLSNILEHLNICGAIFAMLH